MDSRRPMRGAKAMNVHPVNGGHNRPYVKLDRITQIPSPFHHNQNRPSPYSRRMPAGAGPMQMIASPYQIFSPRTAAQSVQSFPGLPPVPPYPFHNMDLTPRRRQGPMTRSRSAHRPQKKQSRLSVKPAPRPQLSARTSLGPKQEKARPVENKPPVKAAAKVAEKPAEKSRRESLRPEPRRRSLAPVARTDFIERNKANADIVAGRRKSVDPTTLKEARAARRQSLPRTVKAARPGATEEVVMAPEPKQEEPPFQTEETNIESSTSSQVTQPTEEHIISDDTKENEQVNEVLTPERPKLEKAELDNSDADSYKSPVQTTSLFLQYLDIKKDDLPNIVADYEDQQVAEANSKQSKKSRCAIM